MTNEPLVSIIVPAYNAAEHLERCVASLWAQTYGDVEIILVDDGSTDGTSELCDALAQQDHRTKVIHLSNGGVSKARNIGMAHALGEFIQFVDADDYVSSTMTAELMAAHKSSGADLVICGYREVGEQGGLGIDHAVEEVRLLDKANLRRHYLELRHLGLTNACWNKLYRKTLIERSQIRFPASLALAEDAVFNCKYLQQCDYVAVIPDALYRYVRSSGEDTLSTRWQPGFYEAWEKEAQSVFAMFEGHDDLLEVQERTFALELATQVVPYLAMHAKRQGYSSYVRRATEIRQDPHFIRHEDDVQATDLRSRVLLPLFKASRFELIAALMGAWGMGRRFRVRAGRLLTVR